MSFGLNFLSKKNSFLTFLIKGTAGLLGFKIFDTIQGLLMKEEKKKEIIDCIEYLKYLN
jgi:hypothetical protein